MTDPWPLAGRERELELFKTSLSHRDRDAFILTGPMGVGKTRLADECLALAAGEGRPVARVVASRTTAGVPFGALAHLLASPTASETGAGDRDGAGGDSVGIALSSWFRRARRGGTDGGRLILLVDDLNLLDQESLTLLAALVEAGEVFLVATVRQDEPARLDTHRMWSRERTLWVEPADLGRAEVTALTSRVLGGPVTRDTCAALWRASRGNPLFLRELVVGALEERTLAMTDGIWRLKGEPRPTSRLRELVDAHMATLGPKARAVLEHLAVCRPLGVSTLTTFTSAEMLAELERSRLIVVRPDGRRRLVTPANPLYAAAIRDRLPRLAIDRILHEHIDRVRRSGARRADDAARLARWQLDRVGRAAPELLRRAMRRSGDAGDFAQVERLARAVIADGRDAALSVRAARSLGEALGHLGRVTEAEKVFESLERAGAGDAGEPAIVLPRALNLAWGCAEPDRALSLLDRCLSAHGDPPDGDLAAFAALILTLCHRPRQAHEPPAAAPGGRDGVGGSWSRLAKIAAFSAMGRTKDALDLSGATAQGEPGGTTIADNAILHTYGRVVALYCAGRLGEAVAPAEQGLEQAVARGVTTTHVAFAQLLGHCHLTAGRPRTAIRWFREAAAISRAHAMAGRLRLAYAGLTMAHSCLADEAASRQAVEEMGRSAGGSARQGLPVVADAWNLAVTGYTGRAIELLLTAADGLESGGDFMLCAALLHDVARLGAPEPVVNRLKALEAATDSAMVAAFSLYAAGSALSDPAVLLRASAAFESLGAMLYAAEATAQAHRWTSDSRKNSAATRVRALLRQCEGARTPPLLAFQALVPLSKREKDICSLAARGLASRDIAARLSLSVRTVDNCLQRSYTKLGISRRTALATALGLTSERWDPGSAGAVAGDP
ncbi:helix-turn-helix transcriptional regulator [Sphaerisporangium sp. NPDC051011]|uniref:helix-turn-helix transcriptional regulator n=1 Tax=Sphaerisporangium sp. NPDC051011 TaxID=3155792 RepID=UPI0033D174A0